MIKPIYLFLLLGILLSSCDLVDPCQNKDLYIKNHITFVEDTEDHQDSYSLEDWEKRDEAFRVMIEDCYETLQPQLDKEEKKAFWIRNTKYLSYRVKSSTEEGIEAFTDVIENLSQDGLAISEGFREVFGEDFKESMETFGNDMNEVFDEDFKNKLNEVFDEDFKRKMEDAVKNLEGSLKEIGKSLKGVIEEIK